MKRKVQTDSESNKRVKEGEKADAKTTESRKPSIVAKEIISQDPEENVPKTPEEKTVDPSVPSPVKPAVNSQSSQSSQPDLDPDDDEVDFEQYVGLDTPAHTSFGTEPQTVAKKPLSPDIGQKAEVTLPPVPRPPSPLIWAGLLTSTQGTKKITNENILSNCDDNGCSFS